MEKIDRKIQIMHRILYLTSAVVVFQIIVERDPRSYSKITWNNLLTNTEEWFQLTYSWSSCILLGILEVALIAVFIKLHKVIKENLVTRLMLRDK
jgi:flagellar biosynthesis protein FlhB